MFTRLKQRLETRAIATMIVAPLVLCVIAFLAIAFFFTLRETLSPAMAALVTSAAGVVLIALFLVLVKLTNRREAASPRPHRGTDPGEHIEAFLQAHADPVLSEWIKNNPDRAMVATLLLGVAAGYSKSVRRALADLYSHYAAAEAERRKGSED
ncbi:MAG: hypothetical protein ACNA8G_09025 [Gammaproteobacteria bacterium]